MLVVAEPSGSALVVWHGEPGGRPMIIGGTYEEVETITFIVDGCRQEYVFGVGQASRTYTRDGEQKRR
ncbi:MAG: hypothetical protein KKA42_06495 [candidate division Zixibacteria bacterium]|nr:hypothetical protein [candidate division Zixibacteria bacterium]